MKTIYLLFVDVRNVIGGESEITPNQLDGAPEALSQFDFEDRADATRSMDLLLKHFLGGRQGAVTNLQNGELVMVESATVYEAAQGDDGNIDYDSLRKVSHGYVGARLFHGGFISCYEMIARYLREYLRIHGHDADTEQIQIDGIDSLESGDSKYGLDTLRSQVRVTLLKNGEPWKYTIGVWQHFHNGYFPCFDNMEDTVE